MARKLIVEIIGDATQLTRSFNQSTVAANKFGAEVSTSAGKGEKGLLRLQKVAAGGFIGSAAISAAALGIREVTTAASDLGEQISKNNQVFGESAKSVQAWSETTAASIGISQTQALSATGTFGNLFKAIQVGEGVAAKSSKELVKLAADLASFNNVDPTEALDAIRSGLVGEAEPLRRFGVLLSEARVQQVAFAQTGKTTAASLTVQEKAMARLAIIFRDTATAQGDFERTSGSLANQQRVLAAQTSDLQANLGQLLLPAITEITSAFVDATGMLVKFGDGLEKLGSIDIPTIVIPIATKRVELGGGTVGGVAGKVFGLGALGFISPAALYGVLVKEAINEIRGEEPPSKPINDLAAAFDDQFSTFTEQAVTKLNSAAEKSVKKGAKAFGEKGFKVSAANELGESLQRAFDATLAALDLELDQSVAADNTAAALRTLSELEATIRKRIEAEGRTTELLRLLFDVEQERARVIAQAAATKKANTDKIKQDRRDAAAALIDALEFGITEAELTAGLRNDIAAMRALERGLERQIRAGVNVVENQRRLTVLTSQIADAERERAANLKKAAQARKQAEEFKAIGLTATGDEPVPGLKNLRKQFSQLSQNVIGQDVPKKLLDRLKKVGDFLQSGIKDIEEPTARAIRELFDAIRDEFDKENNKGPLTKTTSLNANKILEGLGLGRDMEKELRARLSTINSAGITLAGDQRPTGSFRAPGGGEVVVNITTELDGQVVARNTTKHQQAGARRNPRQKRGPNRSGV